MPRGNVSMTYYFQYGTAIMDRTFDRRVDSARLEGQGLLKGWRMDFSREGGQPNLVPDPQGEVWGLLFLIDESKLEELSQAEPGGERNEGSCLFEWEAEPCVFFTYPSQAGRPNDEYLKMFRENYRQAGLPQKQIDRALGLISAH